MGEAGLDADPMISYIDLTCAFVERLRQIPQLVADLDQASPDSIVGYIDLQPKRNSFSAAVYGQKAGTVLVAWQETMLPDGEMARWIHRVNFYVKAQNDQSLYVLVKDIESGVPYPGCGLKWWQCPLAQGLDPTEIRRVARDADTEQIDMIVIETETRETGDL